MSGQLPGQGPIDLRRYDRPISPPEMPDSGATDIVAQPAARRDLSRYSTARPLAFATQLLFGAWLVVAVFGLYAIIRERQAIDGFFAGTNAPDTLARAEDVLNAYNTVSLLLMITTASVFLTWFHRCHANAGVLTGGSVDHRSAAAIGWWFVPVAGWFLPYRIAQESWTASRSPEEPATRSGPIVAWFAIFMLASWVMRTVTFFARENLAEANPIDAAEFQAAAHAAGTADLISISLEAASVVAAWIVVRRLTERQEGTHAQLCAAKPDVADPAPATRW